MAANSAQIKNLLLPGLYKVAGQYERYPKEWDKIFTTVKSTLQTETAVQTRILGLAQLKVEGGATAFDNNMGQRFTWNATANEVALGYAITLRAIEDNQYTKDFNLMNLKLTDSFSQFKEIQGAYDVLSDKEKRQMYDQAGFYSASGMPGNGPRGANMGFGGFDFSGANAGRGAGSSASAGPGRC